MLLVFLDTETTGLNPDKHRTLDIAFKIIDSTTGAHVDAYDSIVQQPDTVWAEADPKSLEINGFTWEKTLSGKPEKAVAAEITNDLNHAGLAEKGGVFICQNPSFDRAFFNQLISVDLQNAYRWPYHWLDLASMHWAYLHFQNTPPTQEHALSKNTIAAHFNLPPEPTPHSALNGVTYLLSCYEAVLHQSLKKTLSS